MPQQVSNAFSGSFSQQTQAEATKRAADAPKTGFSNLPGGILGGVAKLSSIQFKQYEPDTKQKRYDGSSAAGEWYYVATGIVMSPESVVLKDGQVAQVAGLQTRTTLPLCDVKRGGKLVTEWEMVCRAMDEMKLLAGNNYIFCDASRKPLPVTKDLLASVAASLVKMSTHPPAGKHGLFFRFDTTQAEPTKEHPNPMVFENWRGSQGLENYKPPQFAKGGVQDSNQPTATVPPSQPPAQQPAPAPQAAAPPPPVAAPAPQGDDPDALVRLAAGDASLPETAPAQHKLAEMARANGWTDKDIEDAPNWETLGQMAKGRNPSQPPSNGAPYANGAPKKDDVWGYVKVPFNDGGRWRNSLVQITHVHGDGTFDLLNWDDKRTTYTKVPQADLQPV